MNASQTESSNRGRLLLALLATVALGAIALAAVASLATAQSSEPPDPLDLYDANDNGVIDAYEAIRAVADHLEDRISRDLASRVFQLYQPPAGLVRGQAWSSACTRYDGDNNGVIDRNEALSAVQDYFANVIDQATALAVIECYESGDTRPPTPTPTTAPPPKLAPVKPTGLTATATGHQSIRLSWKAAAGASKYRVEQSPGGGGSWSVVSSSVTSTSYSVWSLAPETAYDFRVSSYGNGSTHRAAWSASSSTASATTHAEPTATTTLSINDSRIATISYSYSGPVSSHNYSFSIYRSMDRNGDYTHVASKTVPLSPTTTFSDIILSRGYWYMGWAAPEKCCLPDWSPPVWIPLDPPKVTAPGKPAQPRLTPGDEKLTASWSAPSTGGSAITRYEVQHKEASASWPSGPGTDNGTLLTREIAGLTNGTAYDVQVRACNSKGCGTWSDSAEETPRTVPGKVSRPTLTPGDEKLTASWSAPSTGGAAITGYRVQHRRNSDSWPSDAGADNGTLLTREIAGLTNGTDYDVRVRACNVAGCGAWSEQATETPTTPPPGNRAPYFPSTEDGMRSVLENTASGQDIGSPVAARDRDGDGLDYTLGGADAAYFDINGSSGQLRTSASLDFEMPRGNALSTMNTNNYTVEVTATDDGSPARSASITVTISVTDVDETTPPPTTQPPPPPPNVTAPDKVSRPTLTPGDEKLTVSWSAPANGGAVIRRYDVEYKIATTSTWSGAGFVAFATKKTIEALTNGTAYNVQVRACNVAGCGAWSEQATGTPQGKLTKPTILDVIPLPQRKAKLTWAAVANADGYTVQMRDPKIVNNIQRAWNNWTSLTGTPTCMVPLGQTTAMCHIDIELDKIISSRGLAHANVYEVQVKATDSAGVYLESEYSDEIVIIDTPIIAANGNSPNADPNQGKAEVEWSSVANVAEYKIRWRKLSTFGGRPPDIFTHRAAGWQPQPAASVQSWSDSEAVRAGTLQYRISGLDLYEVYAIQLNFKYLKNLGPGNSVELAGFSAREAYVWPSDRAAGGGERVATFPLNFPVSDRTYAYRICEDLFPAPKVDWRNLIVHALEQWELATDGMVTMTFEADSQDVDGDGDRDESLPCAQYGELIELIRLEVDRIQNIPVPNPNYTALIGQFLNNLDFLTNVVRPTDERTNEIILIDNEPGSVYDNLPAGIFSELASEVGFAECGWTARGCAVPRHVDPDGNNITDILLNRMQLNENHFDLPGGDTTPNRGDVVFNQCNTRSKSTYRTLVHEAGHVLGIRDGTNIMNLPGETHHPTINDSVINYIIVDSDCSPNPFDIMAIYAIYQTVD